MRRVLPDTEHFEFPPKTINDFAYLTEKQVAALTGLSLSKLRQDRFHCRGFPYYKINRSVRYLYGEIFSHIQNHKISPIQ